MTDRIQNFLFANYFQNKLIAKIDSILYDLNQMEIKKPIKISIDSQTVLNCLSEPKPKIVIKSIEEVFITLFECKLFINNYFILGKRKQKFCH